MHLLNLVCSFQWCVSVECVFDQTLAEQLCRDKGLYGVRFCIVYFLACFFGETLLQVSLIRIEEKRDPFLKLIVTYVPQV